MINFSLLVCDFYNLLQNGATNFLGWIFAAPV